MSRFGTVLGGTANARTVVAQGADPESLFASVSAAINAASIIQPPLVDALYTSVTLTGTGDGHQFFIEVEAASGVNVDGGANLVAAPRLLMDSTAEGLQKQIAAIQSTNPILDVQIAGAAQGRLVMALMLFGVIRPAPSASKTNWANNPPTYYVDSNYTGGGNDGSREHPFTTIQQGIDLAWTEVASITFDSWAMVRIATGTYNETALVLYPFVALVGETEDTVRVNSITPIRLYSFGFYNFVNIRFQTPWNSDQTSIFYLFYVWARFWNCRFGDTVTVQGLGADRHIYEMHDCYYDGGKIDVSDVTWWAQDCESYSDIAAHGSIAGSLYPVTSPDGNIYNCGVYIYAGFQQGAMSCDTVSGPNGTWVELDGRIYGAVTVSGVGSTAATMTDGWPDGGLALVGGAVKFALGGAHGGRYEPASLPNWSNVAPTSTGDALDRLAAAFGVVPP